MYFPWSYLSLILTLDEAGSRRSGGGGIAVRVFSISQMYSTPDDEPDKQIASRAVVGSSWEKERYPTHITHRRMCMSVARRSVKKYSVCISRC